MLENDGLGRGAVDAVKENWPTTIFYDSKCGILELFKRR